MHRYARILKKGLPYRNQNRGKKEEKKVPKLRILGKKDKNQNLFHAIGAPFCHT